MQDTHRVKPIAYISWRARQRCTLGLPMKHITLAKLTARPAIITQDSLTSALFIGRESLYTKKIMKVTNKSKMPKAAAAIIVMG